MKRKNFNGERFAILAAFAGVGVAASKAQDLLLVCEGVETPGPEKKNYKNSPKKHNNIHDKNRRHRTQRNRVRKIRPGRK